ncbi:hypothetical protein [Egbenema bharatensis]
MNSLSKVCGLPLGKLSRFPGERSLRQIRAPNRIRLQDALVVGSSSHHG